MADLPADPFGRPVRLPGDFTFTGRITLLADSARRLIRDEPLSREQAMFLGSALNARLTHGGDLERDYLKISAPRGSHRRAEVVAREIILIADERREGNALADCEQSNTLDHFE